MPIAAMARAAVRIPKTVDGDSCGGGGKGPSTGLWYNKATALAGTPPVARGEDSLLAGQGHPPLPGGIETWNTDLVPV